MCPSPPYREMDRTIRIQVENVEEVELQDSFSLEPEWRKVSVHPSESHSLSHTACFEPGPGMGPWEAEKRKSRPLLPGGHSPVGEIDMHTSEFNTLCICAVFLLSFCYLPLCRKENPPPYKHPFLRGPASNYPNGKGDKKSSMNHKDPSHSF